MYSANAFNVPEGSSHSSIFLFRPSPEAHPDKNNAAAAIVHNLTLIMTRSLPSC